MVIDPLTGHCVEVVAPRQSRPNRPPDEECPFCVGGLEAPEQYDVRTFVNRWPPLPDHRCEIVLYTPDHRASLATVGPDHAEKVVAAWAQRTAALGARDDVGYVLVFENRGAEVGATIDHPHGQIYAFTDVPPAARRELDAAECALCAGHDDNLAVASAGDWRAWVPAAAQWPFELRLAPVAHVGDLGEEASDHPGLARVLVDVTARLDRLFAAPMPYMLWIHQRPADGAPWPAAHIHVHIAPLLRAEATPRFVAAGELGSDVYFNPIAPAEAAQRLRDA